MTFTDALDLTAFKRHGGKTTMPPISRVNEGGGGWAP